LPANPDLLEIVKVLLRYLDEHPERAHKKFTHVVLDALWKSAHHLARVT
jgi:hypothetical protein